MYAKYNYITNNGYTAQCFLSDVLSILTGTTDKTWLKGKILLSSGLVTRTAGSSAIVFGGADTGTLEIGQIVYGDGIPDGTTIATITPSSGFTMSNIATTSSTSAIVALLATANLPPATIGSNQKPVSITLNSPTITHTGGISNVATVGMSVSGFGIPSGAIITGVAANTITMNVSATATITNTAVTLSPSAAPCDYVNTFILTTYNPAGWELWDQYGNTGWNQKPVLRAKLIDDPTQYKFVQLDSTTAGEFRFTLYENWNNNTHTGLNQANVQSGSSWWQRVTLNSSGATMALAASPRYFAAQSITSGGIGNSANNGWLGIFERNRLSPWDTITNKYPPTVWTESKMLAQGNSSSLVLSCPRYKNPAGGDFTGVNAALGTAMMGYGGNSGGILGTSSQVITKKIPDGLGGFYCPMSDIQVRNASNAFLGGSISNICDVWIGPGYPNNLDEVIFNGKTYIFWQNSNLATTVDCNTAFLKG